MNKTLNIKTYFLLPIDQQADIAKVVLATCKRLFNEGNSATLSKKKVQLECNVTGELVAYCVRGTELFNAFINKRRNSCSAYHKWNKNEAVI